MSAVVITLAVGGALLINRSGQNLKGDLGSIKPVQVNTKISVPQDETTRRLNVLEQRMDATEAKLDCIKNIYYMHLTGSAANIELMDNYLINVKKCVNG